MGHKNINLPHDRGADGKRVDVSHAADLLGCSKSWVYKLVEDKKLKAYRIGTRKGLQVTMRSIHAYLDRCQITPSS